jgi:hypothetical protein
LVLLAVMDAPIMLKAVAVVAVEQADRLQLLVWWEARHLAVTGVRLQAAMLVALVALVLVRVAAAQTALAVEAAV